MYSESRLPQGAALWRSRGSAGGAAIPADGCVDLILRNGRVLVAGPSTVWIASGGDGGGESLGLRLPPGRAASVLGLDLDEIADRLVPLDDLKGRVRADHLRAAMESVTDARPSAAALAQIAAQAAESSRWSDAVRRAAAEAVAAGDAAADFSRSERSFRRRMLSTFGYGYATLVRLERARHAQTLLRNGSPIGAAAAEAGFADQSHLSREFRRLVGASPRQFASSAA